MQEIFDIIWENLATALAGVSLGSILAAVVSIIVKTVVDRANARAQAKINELDTEAIKKEAVNKAVAQVKAISFKHNIAPIVRSELQKVAEEANELATATCDKVDKRLDEVVNVLEKLSAYFDNSIGVPEEKKEELHQAIEQAKKAPTSVESYVVEEIIEETATEPTNAQEITKTKAVR